MHMGFKPMLSVPENPAYSRTTSSESGTELNHVHSTSHVALGLPDFASLCKVSLAACLCKDHALQVFAKACKAVQQHSLLVTPLLCNSGTGTHTHIYVYTYIYIDIHKLTNMQTRQVKQQVESGTELNHAHSMSHVALGLPAFTSLCSVSLAACLCERACASGHCKGLQKVRGASLRPASCRTRL